MRKNNDLMIVAILAALVVGCDNKPAKPTIQEVNDENCKIEVIKRIEDKETREQFAGRCSRRPVGTAPTKKPKNWLELTN